MADRIRRFVFWLLFAAFSVSVLWIGWFIYGAPSYASLEHLLNEASGVNPLRDIPPVFPNEAAFEIERLAAPLGLRLAPLEVPDRTRPAAEAEELFDAELNQPLKDYFASLMAEQAPDLEPPEIVRDFLDRHREALDALSSFVRSPAGSKPRWGMDYRQGGAYLVPHWRGHMRVHDLLLAAGARAAAAGELESAADWVEAAVNLRRSLTGQLPILYLLFHQAELRHEAALLRFLEVWPPGLEAEFEALLEERKLSDDALLCYRLDTWLFYKMLIDGDLVEGEYPDFLKFLVDRMARHGIRHHHVAMEKMLEPVLERGFLDYEPKQAFEDGMATIPKWSLVARILVPDLTDLFVKTARTELGIELALRAHSARQKLSASGCPSFEPKQPATLDGAFWLYRCEGATLRLEPSHRFEGHGKSLPLLAGLTLPARRAPVPALGAFSSGERE